MNIKMDNTGAKLGSQDNLEYFGLKTLKECCRPGTTRSFVRLESLLLLDRCLNISWGKESLREAFRFQSL